VWGKGNAERDGFERWITERGRSLREFGIFCALAERHGGGWHGWPSEHRRPTAPEVARFAEAHSDRVRFHQWLQWLADRQFTAAAAEIGIMQDLPIGVDPDGADAWAWQGAVATGGPIGSPPHPVRTRRPGWGA